MPKDRTLAPQVALAPYARARALSRHLFDLLAAAAYDTRPIASRPTIVFYQGCLPAFPFNTPLKKALEATPAGPRATPRRGNV